MSSSCFACKKNAWKGRCFPVGGNISRLYGLTEDRLKGAKPDAIVMHPGPINRGVEIDSTVADGPQSVILSQVTYGIAVRMAVMSMTLGSHSTADNSKEQGQ